MSPPDQKKLQRRASKAMRAVRGASTALPDLRRRAIVVLGMHRSGTSALTGVLAEMGCTMPEHLMAPEEMNPKGFFESDAVTGLNERLLASAGMRWFSFPPFPREWYRSAAAAEFAAEADETLRAEYGDADIFAMKDPRICRLVSFWDAVLRRAGCRPVYVCTHRHPVDVASSLQYRSGYDLDYGLLLWLRHQLDAEADSRGKPRVFVSYDQLMGDWATSVTKIGASLNIAWPLSVDEARPGVEGFLSSALRNFAARDDDGSSPMPDWVAEVHVIIERWAALGEDAADHPRLDAIRAHLDAATPTLGQAVRGLQSRAEEKKAQAGVIAGLEERLVAETGALTDRLAAEAAELNDRLVTETTALNRTFAVERAALENRFAAERAQQNDQLAARDQALAAANERAALLDNVILQRAQEIEDRTREAAEVTARLAALQADMDRLRSQHDALRVRHDRENRQLRQMTTHVAALMLRDVDERLDGRTPAAAATPAGARPGMPEPAPGDASQTGTAGQARVEELERQLAELSRHSAGLEVAVRELTSSTSWAMTKPMRWMSGRVRRKP